MFQPKPASQSSQVRQCTKGELWRDWEHVNRGCPGVLIPVQEWHLISLVVVRRIRNGMASFLRCFQSVVGTSDPKDAFQFRI